MDILNFISWIRGKRQVTTVDPAKTLLPVGIKDPKRDDEYIAGAITVEDFATQIGGGPVVDSEGNLIVANSGNDSVIVLNGDSHFIPDFSGMLIVNDLYGGRVELWLAGSGDTVLVSYTQVSGGAPTNTLVMSGNGYVWTNNDNFGNNGDIGITFTVIKTRLGS